MSEPAETLIVVDIACAEDAREKKLRGSESESTYSKQTIPPLPLSHRILTIILLSIIQNETTSNHRITNGSLLPRLSRKGFIQNKRRQAFHVGRRGFLTICQIGDLCVHLNLGGDIFKGPKVVQQISKCLHLKSRNLRMSPAQKSATSEFAITSRSRNLRMFPSQSITGILS